MFRHSLVIAPAVLLAVFVALAGCADTATGPSSSAGSDSDSDCTGSADEKGERCRSDKRDWTTPPDSREKAADEDDDGGAAESDDGSASDRTGDGSERDTESDGSDGDSSSDAETGDQTDETGTNALCRGGDDQSDGECRRTQLLGGSGFDQIDGVATDDRGNIYVTGRTGAGFGGREYRGGDRDAFVAKYDAQRRRQWVRLIGSPKKDTASEIATNKFGEVFVAGTTSGSLEGRSYAGGRYDAFVAKLDSNGNRKWLRMMGTAKSEFALGLAARDYGPLYVVGGASGSINGTSLGGGAMDGFVAKFARSGDRKWVRLTGAPGFDMLEAVSVTYAGEVFVGGMTNGPIDETSYVGGSFDAVVMKFHSRGQHRWTRLVGSKGRDAVGGMTTTQAGDLYVVGRSSETVEGTSDGRVGGFVAKFAHTGERPWTSNVGTEGKVTGVARDGSGTLHVVGYAHRAFGGASYAGGPSDAMVAEYGTEGTRRRVRLFGSPGEDKAKGVGVAPDGDVYVGGSTDGSVDGASYQGGKSDGFLTLMP